MHYHVKKGLLIPRFLKHKIFQGIIQIYVLSNRGQTCSKWTCNAGGDLEFRKNVNWFGLPYSACVSSNTKGATGPRTSLISSGSEMLLQK